MHEERPEETSLLELDASFNQNGITNVLENVSLNTQPVQHFPCFWSKNSDLVSRHQTLNSVPGPSGHNCMVEKSFVKYSVQYIIENFLLVQKMNIQMLV